MPRQGNKLNHNVRLQQDAVIHDQASRCCINVLQYGNAKTIFLFSLIALAIGYISYLGNNQENASDDVITPINTKHYSDTYSEEAVVSNPFTPLDNSINQINSYNDIITSLNTQDNRYVYIKDEAIPAFDKEIASYYKLFIAPSYQQGVNLNSDTYKDKVITDYDELTTTYDTAITDYHNLLALSLDSMSSKRDQTKTSSVVSKEDMEEAWQQAVNSNSDTYSEEVVVSNSFTSCRTAIFYEFHNDAKTVSQVYSWLPLLIKHNYTTFLFEDPNDWSIDHSIEATSYSIQVVAPKAKSELSLQPWVFSLKITKKLLEEIKKQGLTYVAVDMDTTSRNKLDKDLSDPSHIKVRNQVMAKLINEACAQYKTDQVFIVGVMHGGIALILKELGHKVISGFIINHPPAIDPGAPVGMKYNDIMLRNKNTPYMQKYGYEDTHIINYWGDTSSKDEAIAASQDFLMDLISPKSDTRPRTSLDSISSTRDQTKTSSTKSVSISGQQASRTDMVEKALQIAEVNVKKGTVDSTSDQAKTSSMGLISLGKSVLQYLPSLLLTPDVIISSLYSMTELMGVSNCGEGPGLVAASMNVSERFIGNDGKPDYADEALCTGDLIDTCKLVVT